MFFLPHIIAIHHAQATAEQRLSAARLAAMQGFTGGVVDEPHRDTIDVDARFIEDAQALMVEAPPCASFAPRPLTIDVDARVIADTPALPVPTEGAA